MDWTKPASELHNLIRGLNPWPSVTVLFRGKRLKIHRTKVTGEDSSRAAPGTVLSLDPLIVACGQGALILEEVQYEGARQNDCGGVSTRPSHDGGIGDGIE